MQSAQEGKGKKGNFKHTRENTGVAQLSSRAHARVNKQLTNAWLILCNPNIIHLPGMKPQVVTNVLVNLI